MRAFAIRLHRGAGLVMAAVLLVAGLTGIPLAFSRQLGAWLNHTNARTVVPHGVALPPASLIAMAESRAPGYMATGICFCETQQPDESLMIRLQQRDLTRERSWADRVYVYVDPYTGREIDRNAFRNNRNQSNALVPWLVRLHDGMIFGVAGFRLYGAVALLWTIDCFISLLVALPSRPLTAVRESLHGFWARWRHAWRVKWTARAPRVTFDLHRALGLWLWPAFLLFAWSSVALNLNDQVYRPVMRFLAGATDASEATPLPGASMLPPTTPPPLGWSEALQRGRDEMRRTAAAQHFTVIHEYGLLLTGENVTYTVHSTLDIGRTPGTSLTLDAATGALQGFSISGRESAAETITRWLRVLHFGAPLGLWYQVLVAAVALAVVVVSASGVLIWSRRVRTR